MGSNGEAVIAENVKISNPAGAKVWAISTSGKRMEVITIKVEGEGVVFTAKVKGADEARMKYEIASE